LPGVPRPGDWLPAEAPPGAPGAFWPRAGLPADDAPAPAAGPWPAGADRPGVGDDSAPGDTWGADGDAPGGRSGTRAAPSGGAGSRPDAPSRFFTDETNNWFAVCGLLDPAGAGRDGAGRDGNGCRIVADEDCGAGAPGEPVPPDAPPVLPGAAVPGRAVTGVRIVAGLWVEPVAEGIETGGCEIVGSGRVPSKAEAPGEPDDPGAPGDAPDGAVADDAPAP
jgi:hypothetical protein